MYIEFDHNKDRFFKEYVFWDRIWSILILESNFGGRALSNRYIYDNYEIEFFANEIPGGVGATTLRAVRCPDSIETFFKLKYQIFR